MLPRPSTASQGHGGPLYASVHSRLAIHSCFSPDLAGHVGVRGRSKRAEERASRYLAPADTVWRAGARMPSKQPDREMAEPRATRELVRRADVPMRSAAPLAAPLEGVSTVIGFDGQSAADNRRVFGFAFVPPDTNGAVGASQYVQMVNVTIAVYSKRDGTLQLGPDADPFAVGWFRRTLRERRRDRRRTPMAAIRLSSTIISQTAGWSVSCSSTRRSRRPRSASPVSTSSDATGSYNRYQFDFGVNFPDYPKFGIWPDAYYNTINVFPGKGFAGAQACAFDRAAMLTGARGEARSASSSRRRCRACSRQTWTAPPCRPRARRITSSASPTRHT